MRPVKILLWLCLPLLALGCAAPTQVVPPSATSPPMESLATAISIIPTLPTETSELAVTPFPLPTMVTPAAQAEPLTSDSTAEEVRQRVQNPLWHTLWADGTASALSGDGSMINFHAQVWADRFGGGQAISSDQLVDTPERTSEVEPRWAWLSNGQSITLYDLVENSNEPDYYRWFSHPLESAGLVVEMLFPRFVENWDDYPVISEDEVAGRPAVIVDLERAHYWVDAATGVILRYQNITDGVVTTEVRLNAIAYDIPLPAETQLGYLSNQLFFDEGPAPEDYDPSQAALTVEPAMLGDPEEINPSFLVDLYSDGYFLGSLPSGESALFNCNRSPDGGKIAFAYLTVFDDNRAQETLRWFPLLDLNEVHDPLPDLSLASLATWAPDSQHLAFAACEAEGDCGLYLLDSSDGSVVWTQAGLFGPQPVVWNPDGSSLAVLGDASPEGLATLQVLAIEDGQLLYEGDYDLNIGEAPDDSPLSEWGLEFPSSYSNYGNCLPPPA